MQRRDYMSSASALAVLGTTGITTARKSSDDLTTEEVSHAFQNGVMEDGAAGARENLIDLGLDPVVEESQDFEVPENNDFQSNVATSGDDSEVNPQWKYGDPKNTESKLVVSTMDGGDSKVWMAVTMSLRGCKRSFGNASWVKDAIGIGYEAQDWAPIGEPEVHASGEHTARFRAEDVTQDARAGTVNIINPAGSDACDNYSDEYATLTAKFQLRNNKVPTTMWGSYTHTKALSPGATIQSISGGAGGLNVGLGWDANPAWSIAHPQDPSDVV